ncbi:MAG: hypothetical protein U0350_44195 [Caldilineaceae bacterium]
MKSEYYITPMATDQRLTRLLDGFGHRLASGIWHCFFTEQQLSHLRERHGERLKIERASNGLVSIAVGD